MIKRVGKLFVAKCSQCKKQFETEATAEFGSESGIIEALADNDWALRKIRDAGSPIAICPDCQEAETFFETEVEDYDD